MTPYSCPACGAGAAVGQVRCACGADLSLLVELAAVADAWFNRGLAALEAGDLTRALEWLAAGCAARPTDAAALRILARVWGRLGHHGAARDALDRSAAIEANAPDLDDLRRALSAEPGDAPLR
jgi:Tfp pilus assembly protein PilF